MSTRTTFEDRLLDELKKEIGRHERKASVRPLFAPRRIAVVAAACAAAWLGTVAVPGSPADSTAFAVEPRDDGSIMLTVKAQTISVGAQRELRTKVSAWGIHVTIDLLAPGYVCERSKVTPLVGVDQQGNRVPIIPLKAGWDVALRPGNVLAFENTRGASRPRAVEVYKTRAEAEPCVPVKVTLPDD
ncbi:hypothetical protein SLINC_6569 [Streptomyces lincolnensis]|uniref:Uncharacterized protein n=1 Tax=Streptomyces lincolnensis TaxID=1915 RepID=A0A1B1MJW0_STRLN|nr:hypothetical protein [Streptomyces lincolnensis]ANS68793.1 hypothetical protein SLINC_6569 [Streptomyces lincolnensis]AXG53001.1 hypothetical protein SLCG_1846 [Streptomyces lincolnensis]QMV10395.1 hypothetical protein GJU35_35210 [Streptomyces lincolnensis]